MVAQAVAEGILKFVVKRRDIRQTEGMKGSEIAKLSRRKKIISNECGQALSEWGEAYATLFTIWTSKLQR